MKKARGAFTNSGVAGRVSGGRAGGLGWRQLQVLCGKIEATHLGGEDPRFDRRQVLDPWFGLQERRNCEPDNSERATHAAQRLASREHIVRRGGILVSDGGLSLRASGRGQPARELPEATRRLCSDGPELRAGRRGRGYGRTGFRLPLTVLFR